MFDDIKNWVMNTLLPITVWLVVIGCFVAGVEFKDISFVCKNSSTSCTLEKRNYLNIKTSKKVFAPSEVKAVYVETYSACTGGRRHTRFVPRHLVRLVSRDKKDFVVFRNYSNYADANDAKQRIMNCVEHGPYPCKVKR